jgi:acetoacetyl-CoA reductase/3-oxoacyl-[acyl-carrier protein] reductase
LKILIAGASGGIGTYLTEQLSQEHDVYGTYHTRIPANHILHNMSKVDIINEIEVKAWINGVCADDTDLAFIYCVGVNYNCMMHKSVSDTWGAVIESNLLGVQIAFRHILPIMRQRRFGRIILLSSVVPQIGVPGTSAYSASKAALWGLSKAVAMENANHGITINTINLGYFDIGMIEDVPRDLLDKIVSSIPMARLGDPRNIYEAVKFIFKADYLTGSQINLNGGLF